MTREVLITWIILLQLSKGTLLSSPRAAESSRDTTGTDYETVAVDPQQCHQTSCSTVTTEPGSAMALVPYNEESIPVIHKPQRQFTFLGHTLSIAQDWGKHGVAAVVWDAAIVLCEYLTQHPEVVRGTRVLELGAGTGLVGMVAALAGGDVTITERAEVLSRLQNTVVSNLDAASHRFQVSELDWTHDHSHLDSGYDVILGADIIYIEDTFPDLLRTLLHFMGANTKVFISCRIRYERDSKFLSLMQNHVLVSKLYYDAERDIHIYLAQRKGNS